MVIPMYERTKERSLTGNNAYLFYSNKMYQIMHYVIVSKY